MRPPGSGGRGPSAMEFSAEWRRVNGSAPGDMATAEGLQRPPRPRAPRRRGGLRRGAQFPRVLGAPPLQPASLRFSCAISGQENATKFLF